jgi:D-alanyl-D-alanine carboxypeptidase
MLLGSTIGYSQNFSNTRLDSLFNALEAGNKAMGSVSISRAGKVVYSRAFGFYNQVGGRQQKANTLTQYRVSSITKTFTAVMVLQLVQEHQLLLKTPLSKYFRQLPNAGKITVDMLLGHTSGLHSYTGDADYKTYALSPQSKAQMLARIARFKPDFKPGEKTFYSNTNYLLLGYIIEQVTGKSYAANLQQRINSKIGLQHTVYQGNNELLGANQASSYNFDGARWWPVPATNLSVVGAGGAILSTPTELLHFIRALFKLKLIGQAALTSMTPVSGNLGRGLVQVPVADQIAFGNFGIVDGFKNSLLYLPQMDVALAVCVNSANTNDNALVDQILNITLQQLSRTVNLPAAQLASYQGVYTSQQLPLKITIKAVAGHLTMQADNRETLTLQTLNPTQFRYAKGNMLLSFTLAGDKRNSHFTLKQADKVYEFFK